MTKKSRLEIACPGSDTKVLRRSILFLVAAMALCVDQISWSQNMTNSEMHLDQKRLEFAQETIRLYGEQIPAQAQKDILAQKVTLGMSPYEARLAGGAFYFKVQADPKIWPPNADPQVVIDKQSVRPDESKIWMTFENETQFPGDGKQRFEVYFFNGKACEIKKIKG